METSTQHIEHDAVLRKRLAIMDRQLSQLRDIISELKPAKKDVFKLLSQEQVAEIMGMSLETLKGTWAKYPFFEKIPGVGIRAIDVEVYAWVREQYKFM